jgi:hypothetical protein
VNKISQQLGHANPLTTWRYYTRWIPTEVRWAPRAGQRWTDALDSPAMWNQKVEPESVAAVETSEKIGGAEGSRTPDPKTASLVLSQLSYSPTRKVTLQVGS